MSTIFVMTLSRCILLLSILIASTSAAKSWGAKGHRIVALIASHYMDPKAKAKVLERLEGLSIEDASTWADQIRDKEAYSYTHPWHYATVSKGKDYLEMRAPKEKDIMIAIKEQWHILRSTSDRSEEAFAIKMLLHLIGDLHQPLHVGNGIDRGGNEVIVKFFGEEMNLHYLWDRSIIDTLSGSVYRQAQRLVSKVAPSQLKAWQSGRPLDWLRESLSCRSSVYEDLPHDSNSSALYFKQHLPLIEQRLLQAGIRLAMLLNRAYA